MEVRGRDAAPRRPAEYSANSAARCSYLSMLFTTALIGISTFRATAAEAIASPAPIAVPAVQTFAQTNLVALLTSTLQDEYVKDKGELELHVTMPWTPLQVSNGPVTMKIVEMPTIGVTTAFIVRFELLAADRSLGSWQMPVQAHIWHEAWVAHSMLKRGDALAGADVAREKRDLLTIHEPLAEFSPDDPTLEFAEPVGVGSPIFARSIAPMPVVHRGETVTALVEDGALSIEMKVEVLEDGAPGQIVRARNQQSLRNIRGKVLNEQTILVSL